MNEIGARVVSDATAAQTGRRRPEMRQAAPFAAQIDRHPMDVIAVAGDPVMAEVQLVVGSRRTIAADHQERLLGFEPVAHHPEKVEDPGIHWPDLIRIVVAQHPVDIAHRLSDVVAIRPVNGADPLAGMSIVKRHRTRCEGERRDWRDKSNGRCGSGSAYDTTPAQHGRQLHWLFPPNSPGDAIALARASNKPLTHK